MGTRRLILLFAVAAAMAIPFFASGCAQNGGYGPSNQGRVVFTVADAAADMGAVTSVKVTVDSLQVQNAAQGWVTVSSSPHTYDLLQLKASKSQSLLADAKLGEGAYGQVRMHISKVMITDSSGEHEAKLPSGDLRIAGGFEVKQNSTTAVTFDFLADKSVHVTGNGKYILAPVVRMQGHEDAEVDASSWEDVKVIGGRIRTDTEVGMDLDGNVGAGLRVPQNALISIDSGNRLRIIAPPRACTEEAKICPDGSAVGRQGQNCEFADCPQANYTLYGKITIGPLCPVEPCIRIFDYSVVSVNVYDAASKNRVAKASADSSGYYKIKLPQGNYLVNVTDEAGNSFGLPRLDYTQSISIEEGRVIEMDFDVDTGIR